MKTHLRFALLPVIVTVLLAGCQGGSGPTPAASQESIGETEAATPTSFHPVTPDASPTVTPTPVPLALTVNGESVTLDEYNLALQRFHLGVPEAPTEEARQRVLDDAIDQILLAQGAVEAGFVLSEEDWQARYAGLVADAGGEEAFAVWLEVNLYSREQFELDLLRSIAAAWMRDQIFAGVSLSAEQVRARHVRLNTRGEADDVLAQINGGTEFDLMIAFYDPEGLGDLGWFPRGVLFEPAIEEAAFALSVGDHSGVIETSVGFHIVEVTDYAADRPLDPDALWALKLAALADWIENRRAASNIEILVP